MNRAAFTLCLIFGLASAASAETPAPVLALRGLDPIALIDGKEVAGLETLECTRGLFRYRFASPENKRALEANPEERGIQFGGACGKMGPFSGAGSPDRFFVHDRRIYVFASESCRDSFKKDPEKHIERPNPVPEGTADQKKRGAALLEQTLVGFGGAKKVDELKNIQTVVKHIYKQGDKETVGTHRTSWAFPDRVRIEEEFSKPYGFVVRGKEGFQIAGTDTWPLESAMRDIAWRQALRQPLAVLHNRKAKGLVAVANGQGKVDETPVELLTVALDGATSTWSVDTATGRILQVTYQARRGVIGDVVVKFGDFRGVDGLVVPHRSTTFFNGKEVISPEVRIERVVLNGDVKPELFERTK